VTGQVQAALPSVAVTTSGVVGVLFDTFDGLDATTNFPIFTAHLSTSTDHGSTFTDLVLETFMSSAKDCCVDPTFCNPGADCTRQRVLGDYQQVKALGTIFYGVFTGNGVPFGRPFANHDPIFFKFDVGCTSITCPPNQTQSNDPGQCGAIVTYNNATPDGAGCGTITCNPASGTFFPVGVTTVTCTDTAGPSCMFTVTVNDTEIPTIICPPTVTAITNQNLCPSPACVLVNYPPPMAMDNCPGVTTQCNPPSGSCFPVGVTTVTCTATDVSGNVSLPCSFTVTTFDTALQDDSSPSTILLWNSVTGQYRFCCNGITFTGIGKTARQGCIYTLDQTNAIDRRVLGRVDKSVHSGTASIQAPPGTTRCTITDRNTLNDTNLASCQ
jgi:hypothetical protein